MFPQFTYPSLFSQTNTRSSGAQRSFHEKASCDHVELPPKQKIRFEDESLHSIHLLLISPLFPTTPSWDKKRGLGNAI